MGTPMFAVPILKSLYQNGYPISNVYTQPPQKSQRGQRINKSPIQGIAETLNLDFRTPKSLKDNNDVYLVPRVNTVEGLTQEHINKWRWNVDPEGWINYPDYQWRIWKNIPSIKWKNKVHEVLEGHKSYSNLPAEEYFSLYHHKQIERQEKQNQFYDTLT